MSIGKKLPSIDPPVEFCRYLKQSNIMANWARNRIFGRNSNLNIHELKPFNSILFIARTVEIAMACSGIHLRYGAPKSYGMGGRLDF